MKPIVSTVLLAGSLGLATAAQAQVRVGVAPLLGFTFSSSRYTSGPTYIGTAESTYRPGFQGGLTASIEQGHFALQPALLFSQEGYNIHITYPSSPSLSSSDSNVRLDYVKLPLNVAYTFQPTGQGLRVFAGGYVSFLQGGKQVLSGSLNGERPVVASEEYQGGNAYYARGLDAGLQAGVGARIEGLLLQLSYSLGLRDTYVGQNNTGGLANSSYNRSFQLSLAYLFNLPH